MLNLLCKYTRIRISIPKALINKCLKDNTISHQDKIKLGRKSAEIESAINKLKHIQSIVEKIENKIK